MKPPIQQEQAKQDLLPFVSSVVCALKELHDFGIAHLDIRLETGCCDSNKRAVLIDLDRFEPVNCKVCAVVGLPLLWMSLNHR